jgi:Flp pilus assembly protein TadD
MDAEQGGDADPGSDAPPSIETFASLLHRGSELLRDGDLPAALECVSSAVQLFPKNVVARQLLARTLFQSGELARALAVYEELHRECPQSVAVKVNLAVVWLKLGRAATARALLEEVAQAHPEHRRAWGYLGVTLEQLGLVAEAEGAFVAGHFASAARRLRERHPGRFAEPPSVRAMTPQPAVSGSLGYGSVARFERTLHPPALDGATAPTRSPPANDAVEEIAFEHTMGVPGVARPPTISRAPKQPRAATPLLDAALSSLLVVPHEATVVGHPSGLVVVGLVAPKGSEEGGFAARSDTVHAFAGPLKREPLAPRSRPAAEPFRESAIPFVHISGNGQLVLAPPPGKRLLPLDMDADVAFLREDIVLAFDNTLLTDLGRLAVSHRKHVTLVRFRGDGVIVLGLDSPFLAFDVRKEQTMSLRAESLLGWIGVLTPEEPGGDLLTFSGEGTVLFRVPDGMRKD